MRRFAGKMGGGGFMNIGKSKAKVYVETDTKVNFADVAGIEEAKDELKETGRLPQNPEKFGRLGGRAPKGVLFVGPRALAKPLLAKAVAGEAGVPFFSTSGSEFVEMFVGVGAASVCATCSNRRAPRPPPSFSLTSLTHSAAPALREARWVATTKRSRPSTSYWSSWTASIPPRDWFYLARPTGPKCLTWRWGKCAAASTARWWSTARTSRDASPYSVCTCKIRLAEGVDRAKVADLTPGFTGAELANLCNEAALAATRRDAEAVALEDFTVAIERIAGLEKRNRVLSPIERETVAHHEMGHALAAMC